LYDKKLGGIDDELPRKRQKTNSRPNLLPVETGSVAYSIVHSVLNNMITKNIDTIAIFHETIESNKYKYNIEDRLGEYIFFECVIDPNDNSVSVDYIQKTPTFNGHQLIQIIDNLAATLQCSTVTLEDMSYVEYEFRLGDNKFSIKFPLYCFYILKSGKSWYNSFGYYGINYQFEIGNNAIWISKPYSVFLIDLLAYIERQSIDFHVIVEDHLKIMNKINEYLRSSSLISSYVASDGILLIITNIFNNLLFIAQSYNADININTLVTEFFAHISAIIKDFSEDEKKYLLLLHLNVCINIISAIMHNFVELKRQDFSIGESFLYYDCFDNGGDALVKTFDN
jgi:hypothetical protein